MVWDLYGSDYARQTTLRLEQELRERALHRQATWGFPARGGRRAARRQSRHDLKQATRPAVLPIPR